MERNEEESTHLKPAEWHTNNGKSGKITSLFKRGEEKVQNYFGVSNSNLQTFFLLSRDKLLSHTPVVDYKHSLDSSIETNWAFVSIILLIKYASFRAGCKRHRSFLIKSFLFSSLNFNNNEINFYSNAKRRMFHNIRDDGLGAHSLNLVSFSSLSFFVSALSFCCNWGFHSFVHFARWIEIENWFFVLYFLRRKEVRCVSSVGRRQEECKEIYLIFQQQTTRRRSIKALRDKNTFVHDPILLVILNGT